MEPAALKLTWKPGDDPNTRDGPGRTPLHIVCQLQEFKSPELNSLRLLLSAGADPNANDSFGRTPLSLICKEIGNAEAVKVLLESGADVNGKDDWGRTALHWCCDRGWMEATLLLLDYGAEINTTTKHGDTPLLWAAKANQEQLVEVLLSAGCDVTVKNNRRETACDVTTDDFIRTLILASAPPSAATVQEEPPISAPTSVPLNDELVPNFPHRNSSSYVGEGGSTEIESKKAKTSILMRKEKQVLSEEGGGVEANGGSVTGNVQLPFAAYSSRSSESPAASTAAPKKLKITLRKK